MAVTVRKLYESVRDMGIELLAGGAGLNRGVRWVHMVESKEISTFLEERSHLQREWEYRTPRS